MNNNIIIGSGEEHLALFHSELPRLTYISFRGFKPGYSHFLPQYLSIFFKTPLLVYHIMREHFRLKKIIKEHSIDIVISDNRFGLWNRKTKTVYITHMPLIPFPKPVRFLEIIGVLLHRAVIRKYSWCFIPDLPGDVNVSGRLSHGVRLPENVRFTGILSRFSKPGPAPEGNTNKPMYNTVILSGPEPQRGIFKQKVLSLLKEQSTPTIILEGKPGNMNEPVSIGNVSFINHLPSLQMQEIITGSKSIITRSGYSTIMELISLKCSALLIPTPGQTEQEYLAEYLTKKGWFSSLALNKLREGISLPENKAVWSDEIIEQSEMLLNKALKEMLEEPHKESQSQ